MRRHSGTRCLIAPLSVGRSRPPLSVCASFLLNVCERVQTSWHYGTSVVMFNYRDPHNVFKYRHRESWTTQSRFTCSTFKGKGSTRSRSFHAEKLQRCVPVAIFFFFLLLFWLTSNFFPPLLLFWLTSNFCFPFVVLEHAIVAKLMKSPFSDHTNNMGPPVWVGDSPPNVLNGQDFFWVSDNDSLICH